MSRPQLFLKLFNPGHLAALGGLLAAGLISSLALPDIVTPVFFMTQILLAAVFFAGLYTGWPALPLSRNLALSLFAVFHPLVATGLSANVALLLVGFFIWVMMASRSATITPRQFAFWSSLTLALLVNLGAEGFALGVAALATLPLLLSRRIILEAPLAFFTLLSVPILAVTGAWHFALSRLTGETHAMFPTALTIQNSVLWAPGTFYEQALWLAMSVPFLSPALIVRLFFAKTPADRRQLWHLLIVPVLAGAVAACYRWTEGADIWLALIALAQTGALIRLPVPAAALCLFISFLSGLVFATLLAA